MSSCTRTSTSPNTTSQGTMVEDQVLCNTVANLTISTPPPTSTTFLPTPPLTPRASIRWPFYPDTPPTTPPVTSYSTCSLSDISPLLLPVSAYNTTPLTHPKLKSVPRRVHFAPEPTDRPSLQPKPKPAYDFDTIFERNDMYQVNLDLDTEKPLKKKREKKIMMKAARAAAATDRRINWRKVFALYGCSG